MSWAALALLFIAAIQAGSTPALDLLPANEGVYIWRGAEGWEKIYRAVLDDKKSKGLDRFIQTDGQTVLSLTLTFEGSNSPVQIPERRPMFFVRNIPAGDDTLIVQLESRKDTRQVRTSSTLIGSSNREGFRPGDIRRVRIGEFSKGCISIMPQEDLKPGEYLLVFGRVENAFDFGIQVP